MKLTSDLLIFMTAISLASCSDDDRVSNAPDDISRIRFSVSVPKAQRSVTTTNSIETFRTWGFVDGKIYMENVEVKRADNGSWSYNPSQYWPADQQKINFYSYSPAIVTSTETTAENPDIPGFVNGGKTDLLYGVNIGESSKASPVRINFRHALAQVKFLLKRMTPPQAPQALKVSLLKVDLLGTYSIGSFNFPDETTSADNATVGSWSGQTASQIMEIYDGAAILGDDAEEFNSTGNMFAIPQELPASTVSAGNYNGSYARILCEIYDENTDVKLWPSQTDANYDAATGAGYIYFPLNSGSGAASTWDAGKSYRYVLTVGVPENGSGYIDFDITVDDYDDFN